MTRTRTVAALMLAVAGLGCSPTPKTYAAHCSTPLKHWGRPKDGIGHLRMVQPAYLASDGSLEWNGKRISDDLLRRYMLEMSALEPTPQAVLEVAPTTECARVEAVRAIMDAAPMCKGAYSICSEGADWKRWPITGGP